MAPTAAFELHFLYQNSGQEYQQKLSPALGDGLSSGHILKNFHPKIVDGKLTDALLLVGTNGGFEAPSLYVYPKNGVSSTFV